MGIPLRQRAGCRLGKADELETLKHTIMTKRVLPELTPECEITARLYAQGMEKKEIADLKCRAISTVANQLQKAFEVLKVRNGRELATLLHERLTGLHLTMNFDKKTRTLVTCCLLGIFSLSFIEDFDVIRRSRRVERIEEIRIRTRRD